jgi:hypothetical protein
VNARRLALLGVPLLLVAAVAGVVLTGGSPLTGTDGPDDPVSATATPEGESEASDPTAGTASPDDGPTPGAGTGGTATATPTAAPATPTGDGGDTTTATATPPFAFSVDRIETCGTTCRDVTSRLTNQRDEVASDVAVTTRIYAGNGTDGDAVWTGSEQVGRLGPGESYTATRRVELSYGDAFAVRNEGWVTVETTVRTADRTVTDTDRRQVA